MNYFEHVSKATSWEVLDLPPSIEVTKTQLTDEEIEEWTRKLKTPPVDFSPDSLAG